MPRERDVIRAGVIDRGCTVNDPALIALARGLRGAVPFVGADQHPVPHASASSRSIFEINPRFSGGIPLTIASGADFPRMLVDLASGTTVDRRLARFATVCG